MLVDTNLTPFSDFDLLQASAAAEDAAGTADEEFCCHDLLQDESKGSEPSEDDVSVFDGDGVAPPRGPAEDAGHIHLCDRRRRLDSERIMCDAGANCVKPWGVRGYEGALCSKCRNKWIHQLCKGFALGTDHLVCIECTKDESKPTWKPDAEKFRKNLCTLFGEFCPGVKPDGLAQFTADMPHREIVAEYNAEVYMLHDNCIIALSNNDPSAFWPLRTDPEYLGRIFELQRQLCARIKEDVATRSNPNSRTLRKRKLGFHSPESKKRSYAYSVSGANFVRLGTAGDGGDAGVVGGGDVQTNAVAKARKNGVKVMVVFKDWRKMPFVMIPVSRISRSGQARGLMECKLVMDYNAVSLHQGKDTYEYKETNIPNGVSWTQSEVLVEEMYLVGNAPRRIHPGQLVAIVDCMAKKFARTGVKAAEQLVDSFSKKWKNERVTVEGGSELTLLEIANKSIQDAKEDAKEPNSPSSRSKVGGSKNNDDDDTEA